MASGYYIKSHYVGGDLDDSIGQIVLYIADTEESVHEKGYLPCGGRKFDRAKYPHLYLFLQDDRTPTLDANGQRIPHKECECGKEKHNFAFHLYFCPKWEKP